MRTTLDGVADVALEPPVTIVIGPVAGLDLSWYESRPLFGKVVVVTRAAHQAPDLTERVAALGAHVLELPVIALGAAADGGVALQGAVARLRRGDYSWLVFTSANAVHRFFELVPDTRSLGSTLVAAVGEVTAEAALDYRVVADLVPADYSAEGLIASFPAAPPAPARRAVLLPQAAGARPELRHGLADRGWDVHAVEAYRTVPQTVSAELLAAAARADAICFASSSAVDSYVDQASGAGLPTPPVVACIGPATAATARRQGLTVDAEAGEHTLDGLVTALLDVLG